MYVFQTDLMNNVFSFITPKEMNSTMKLVCKFWSELSGYNHINYLLYCLSGEHKIYNTVRGCAGLYRELFGLLNSSEEKMDVVEMRTIEKRIKKSISQTKHIHHHRFVGLEVGHNENMYIAWFLFMTPGKQLFSRELILCFNTKKTYGNRLSYHLSVREDRETENCLVEILIPQQPSRKQVDELCQIDFSGTENLQDLVDTHNEMTGHEISFQEFSCFLWTLLFSCDPFKMKMTQPSQGCLSIVERRMKEYYTSLQ